MMRAGAARPARRRVDGVVLLDKPAGLSSNAALQRVKRLYAAEKAGHTGTLDPLATGLLPVCLGEATKFAQALLDSGKRYVATIRFGNATTTGDAEGSIIESGPVDFDEAELRTALRQFVGVLRQQPPRYAALKFAGRNYYEYAREGIEIPRPAREVTIGALTLVDWTPPLATIDVACGKGTYIRVLAEDIARALGSCAHLAALRRTATGPFDIEAAVGLEALEALDLPARDALLLPVDAPLADLPNLVVDAASARALLLGQLPPADAGASGRCRGYDAEGRFLGLLEVAGERLRAVRLVRARPASGL